MWEFTITIESLDYSGYGSYSNTLGSGASEVIDGLRAQIKKISRGQVGRDGRNGAVFERGGPGGIVPEDPLLRAAAPDGPPGANGAAGAGQGRWRIPLGSYHPLMTFLTADTGGHVVEGIPPEQLRAATLGRERMDKKAYPTVSDLVERNVAPVIAVALAPYQRAGVEFILDKEGRALLADEMGLGKTVQAIAAMSAFRGTDWPLLVLCPSTARYHWEAELRAWMGSEARKKAERDRGGIVTASTNFQDRNANFLKNSEINVLTSGRCPILSHTNGMVTTKVVICSIGLIVNLATSGRINPGMFKAVIVDESHVLKSKNTKRTKAVLPILKAAKRCLLLSGTPAFARPSELWPQLSVLGSRRRGIDGNMTSGGGSGIWCDEAEFMSKYVKPKGEDSNRTKLAELHTMLTSTVMIRRMKADILKSLPSKIREKAYLNVKDEGLRDEFRTYMGLLRQGKGVLGKLARAHHSQQPTAGGTEPHASAMGDDGNQHKAVLHHLYNLTGRSKVERITRMLVSWLADTTKGKLCIFAHHLDVLDGVSEGAGLSNRAGSSTKYIRIDGSTSPKARQEQILKFQTDPATRIAMLGITAAGVAVTLTASSTVWFAELFWTPAILIQAEDRCHRIGQQGRVRCLYFILRGTLDEVLWKLIEKKFRDLGEFVEGKENMGIALERELEDDEEDQMLKNEEEDNNGENGGKKRKAQDAFGDMIDADDLAKEFEEIGQEEMKKGKNAEEVEEMETAVEAVEGKAAQTGVIELLDDDAEDDDGDKPRTTISDIRELYRSSGILARLKIDPQVQFVKMRIYNLQYPGPSYGLIMVACNGRVVIKSHHSSAASASGNGEKIPKIGAIIVGVNGRLLPYRAAFVEVLKHMKEMMRTPPVTVMFAEDDDFISMFTEDFMPNLPVRKTPQAPGQSTVSSSSQTSLVANSSAGSRFSGRAPLPSQGSEVIELSD